MIYKNCAVLILCLFFFGCKPNGTEIYGSYRAVYPYAEERLKLVKDGSYIQYLRMQGERDWKEINKGIWKKSAEGIAINNPVIVDNGFGKLNELAIKDGMWPLRIKKSILGAVYAPINEDLGFEFVQESQ